MTLFYCDAKFAIESEDAPNTQETHEEYRGKLERALENSTACEALSTALNAEVRSYPITLASPAEIQRARDEYQNDDCEIDDRAPASKTDTGVWVAAWVWLPNGGDDAE